MSLRSLYSVCQCVRILDTHNFSYVPVGLFVFICQTHFEQTVAKSHSSAQVS